MKINFNCNHKQYYYFYVTDNIYNWGGGREFLFIVIVKTVYKALNNSLDFQQSLSDFILISLVK